MPSATARAPPQASPGTVQFGAHGASASVPSSSITFPNIGQLHAAVFSFAQFGVAVGERAWYRVSADAGATWSANFSITPIVAVPRIAVWGDFGLANDIIMSQLAADSSRGLFDAVAHVGDFAYDMEEQGSTVGNKFQELASQSYAAILPVGVVPGNHEACGGCPQVPSMEYSRGNFSECVVLLLACARPLSHALKRPHSFRPPPSAGTARASAPSSSARAPRRALTPTSSTRTTWA
jgi:hypothetical protein